jgi:hypothetical protein
MPEPVTRRLLQYFRFAELIVILQVLLGMIGLYIAWRNYKIAKEDHELGYCAVQRAPPQSSPPSPQVPSLLTRITRFATTTTPKPIPTTQYPISSALASALFVPDSLGAQAETEGAEAAALAYSSGSSTPVSQQTNVISSRGFVSEDQELSFLVQVLQQYYLYSYNLYWQGQVSGTNPFTNNQCLNILTGQPNQTQYEKLSQDIEAYAALSIKSGKPLDVQYALTLAYFITRVRIIQIQNATVDLSQAAVYNPTTNTITFTSQFITVVSPQLGPQTKALISTGSCSPAQLASTMLLAGEHNPTFQSISTGQKAWTFLCGSAS